MRTTNGFKMENCFPELFGIDETARKRFNALPRGAYYLSYSTANGRGHASVYLKYEFGSYIFDPNQGLMPCSQQNADQDLATLLTSYRKTPDRDIGYKLDAFACELS